MLFRSRRNRGNGVGGLVQNRIVGMAGAENPHNGDGHKHDDERRDGADNLGDLINVEKSNNERNGKQNEGTNRKSKCIELEIFIINILITRLSIICCGHFF